MTSNLPIGTELEVIRPFIGYGMYVNNVHRYGNIPVGRHFIITEREDVEPELAAVFGTYVYEATATVNGEKHDVDFWGHLFDDGAVRVSRRKLKSQGRDLTSAKRVGLSKNLPEDVESVIGSFLTGKKKSTTKGQMDKLLQQTGVSLAPRAGGRTRRHRKTRRRHK